MKGYSSKKLKQRIANEETGQSVYEDARKTVKQIKKQLKITKSSSKKNDKPAL